ncbi:SRPBCC domain-containing protein [Devosia sp.]|uniref:SRPBCC domain-containing protein n=1 Tax=Devosia sp. TaxID=1871048 RepID=UPI002AFF7267|nr:SRPBCC domain-containing protein [Devosia sp.]
MTARPDRHATFTIERTLPGRPVHAWRFWAEPALKQAWSGCHPDWTMLEEAQDFRAGGRDFSRMRDTQGTIHAVDIRYLDLLAPRRILYAYTMHQDGLLLSAGLVTIDLLPRGAATGMVYTEQLTVLAGDMAARRAGTAEGFDRLVLAMGHAPATLH